MAKNWDKPLWLGSCDMFNNYCSLHLISVIKSPPSAPLQLIETIFAVDSKLFQIAVTVARRWGPAALLLPRPKVENIQLRLLFEFSERNRYHFRLRLKGLHLYTKRKLWFLTKRSIRRFTIMEKFFVRFKCQCPTH